MGGVRPHVHAAGNRTAHQYRPHPGLGGAAVQHDAAVGHRVGGHVLHDVRSAGDVVAVALFGRAQRPSSAGLAVSASVFAADAGAGGGGADVRVAAATAGRRAAVAAVHGRGRWAVPSLVVDNAAVRAELCESAGDVHESFVVFVGGHAAVCAGAGAGVAAVVADQAGGRRGRCCWCWRGTARQMGGGVAAVCGADSVDAGFDGNGVWAAGGGRFQQSDVDISVSVHCVCCVGVCVVRNCVCISMRCLTLFVPIADGDFKINIYM